MKKQCSSAGCKEVIEVPYGFRGSPRCAKHPARPIDKKLHSHQYERGEYIYKSPKWVKLRAKKLRLDPFCTHCEKIGLAVVANTVDHIKEIRDGGAKWDINNLQSLCSACHNTKTAKERRKRERRQKSGGHLSVEDFT